MITKRALKPLWAAADLAIHRPVAGVVILAYHRIGAGTTSEVDLPVELFGEQCAELAASGRVRPLDEALRYLEADLHPADPPIVITFDDGTADFVDNALPVLVEHGLPATLYAASRWIDEAVPFWADGPALTWTGLRQAVSTGLVTVGSHTHSHVLLDRLDPSQIDDELDRSIDSIGAGVGIAPADFAYPKALQPSPDARAAVAARFRSAALAGTRANLPGWTDVQRLARSPVQCSDGMRWWRRKVAGGMGAEDRGRDRLNRLRYGGLSA